MDEQKKTTQKEHIYYQLKFDLQSSLLIGNGESRYTDNDLLLNGAGVPYIPGSTIAGMLRAMIPDISLQDKLFGSIEKKKNGNDDIVISNASILYIYDAVCVTPKENLHISKRDNVALNEYKTAIDKKKYDYQVLEPDAVFISIIEIKKGEDQRLKEEAEKLLQYLAAVGCAFGSKKTRGMGRVTVSVKKRSFDLSNLDEMDQWLAFNPFDQETFGGIAVQQDAGTFNALWSNQNACFKERMTIQLGLRQKGGISIRVYTAAQDKFDYYMIGYIKDTPENNTKQVIVPGTSWAGAFRSRVKEFLNNDTMANMFFGYVQEKTAEHQSFDTAKQQKAQKSLISFSETVLSGGISKTVTRNAIDRFSGKTRDGALYGEKTYYYGEGTLMIDIDDANNPDLADARRALGAAIADLHHGYLSVGGLTSIGRGLFEITQIKINGSAFPMGQDWENNLIQKLGNEKKSKEVQA